MFIFCIFVVIFLIQSAFFLLFFYILFYFIILVTITSNDEKTKTFGKSKQKHYILFELMLWVMQQSDCHLNCILLWHCFYVRFMVLVVLVFVFILFIVNHIILHFDVFFLLINILHLIKFMEKEKKFFLKKWKEKL